MERCSKRFTSPSNERRIPPGTKLAEDTLAEIFDTGRMQVRRVLNRLADRKLVSIRPNRGAFVATPTIEEAREVLRRAA